GCCLYASITDLKERRIRNFCSLGLLYCGFILQVIFWLQGWIPFSYLISVTLGGAVLAYLSYIFNFFAPGDAKLFWAVCVALPPLLFKSPKGYMFAPIVLGVNVFIPYLVVLFIYALFKTDREERLRVIRTVTSPKAILTRLFGLFGFVGVGIAVSVIVEIIALKLRLSIAPGSFVRFLLAIGVYQAIIFWARSKGVEILVPLLGTLAYLVIFIYMGFSVPRGVQHLLFILIGIYVGIYALLRPLILSLINSALAEEKAGMVPATIAFAPFITLGVLLTVICRGPIYSFLLR
ncbi:hypothetical protein J7M22_04795, partial [Candidatus Poribacteria bacterium]|nr:hypothetical protein [Candidatus Poribacteria bacterium]